ncbi:MAG: PRC-barrel domain-containing protein [Hyphomicrobiaceae bacterium]
MTRFGLMIAAVAALAVTTPALAQQTAPKVAIPTKTFFKGQAIGQYLIKDRLIGNNVYNREGQVIGDIEDVIVDSGNQVQGVIMGIGGFVGVGEKKVGVRYSALQFSTKDGKTTITLPGASKEVLAALEPYKRAEPKKSLLERAKDKARELTDKSKETAGPAMEKAKETAKEMMEKAKETAGPAMEKAKETAKDMMDKATQPSTPKN